MSGGGAPDVEALLDAINAHGRGPAGWTRPPWSAALRAAEDVAIAAGAAHGLVAQHDPAGNLWLLDAAAPATGLVAAGSHLDTVPDGGGYDGSLGVACALAAIGRLRATGARGAERLAVVAFADEEGWRFGTPIFGSRILTGRFGADVLDRVDAEGVRLGDVCPPDPLAARGGHRRLAAFLEVHVEQGLALAPADAPIGVATGLAARGRYAWSIAGEANHAGTTPMAGRKDALVGAARLVLAAEREALARAPAVATVGRLEVEPGGSNVVPGATRGTLDVRATETALRDELVAAVAAAAPDATLTMLAEDDAVAFDPALRAALHAAAARRDAATLDLPSFAGHDAGVLAAAGVPAAMLFVRSPTGISHNPAEACSPADRALAVELLVDVLGDLAAR